MVPLKGWSHEMKISSSMKEENVVDWVSICNS